MLLRVSSCCVTVVLALAMASCANLESVEFDDCARYIAGGFRPVAQTRDRRFLGKVEEDTARCRGGDKAAQFRARPWVDWANYWSTGDASSKAKGFGSSSDHLGPNGRGIDGALIDLEYQRIELVKFNLFDNAGTYTEYVRGRDGVGGQALRVWDAMRLKKGDPNFTAVGGDGAQLCSGSLIRFRNLSGICNDIKNPAMGATDQLFARNVQPQVTFPDLGKNELARNRHADRLDLLKPDPQVISRKLFTRTQSQPDKCRDGQGLPGYSTDAQCDYKKAPFFNVLAAFWIQFMTHDWFSHLREENNDAALMRVGCTSQKQGGVETALTPEQARQLGCRPGDQIDKALVAEGSDPPSFSHDGKQYLARAYKTTQNTVTAWWDGSQLYGYDENSRKRLKRDPNDTARVLLVPVAGRSEGGDRLGYLTVLLPTDPQNPHWVGQEATAFPNNWTIGLSFYHNVFAREHNAFVDTFRKQAKATPDADSGLRNPSAPDSVIRYRDVTPDELFEVARLVVAAEMAKIHTIEWTTQLLYDEPLFRGLNSNWSGLIQGHEKVAEALERIVVNNFGKSEDVKRTTQWYSVFASGPGIFGLGNHVYADDRIFARPSRAKVDLWSLKNPEHVNGGVNHFGSPFNFPEEFPAVYRLHALVPDLIEYRELGKDPNTIRNKIPVVETLRGKATAAMHERGLANWALSMGRQRLGALTLQNHPRFLQALSIPRLNTPTNQIDVIALDLIRDRERGVPRFNEFRRQYGLQSLTSFNDFVDVRLAPGSAERVEQERLVGVLREVYGQHKCDNTKIITDSQLNADGSPITDCLGQPNGTLVDNIEDLDNVVGWHSEFVRPHGYAISETQFQVFILNASRRLFSDRFFTSSFRPEFYSKLGVDWVNDNGPDGKVMEKGRPNGHVMEVSPLKRVLQRTMPELAGELEGVVNAFDPWARDRGEYYSLEWKPQPRAKSDPAFK